jgi:thiosulfate dehydrogenase
MNTHDATRHVVLLLSAIVLSIASACSRGDVKQGGDESASAAIAGESGGARTTATGDSARGLALMNAFRDSLPAHSGNTLRCTSCHLDGGTRPTAMPWIGTTQTYPRYRSRSGGTETIQMRINDCIARSLAGRMLAEDSRDMQDMVAYLVSIGGTPRPSGVDTVTVAGHANAGERGYAASCARCHGAAGEGTAIAPAVFGVDSYSIGAGMARQKMLSTFLRHNMPFDQPGTLSPQDAADIAAYVLAQPRQDMPGKESDWPKGDPPKDVAYATDGARAAGKPLPPARPVLPRRVAPGNSPR